MLVTIELPDGSTHNIPAQDAAKLVSSIVSQLAGEPSEPQQDNKPDFRLTKDKVLSILEQAGSNGNPLWAALCRQKKSGAPLCEECGGETTEQHWANHYPSMTFSARAIVTGVSLPQERQVEFGIVRAAIEAELATLKG